MLEDLRGTTQRLSQHRHNLVATRDHVTQRGILQLIEQEMRRLTEVSAREAHYVSVLQSILVALNAALARVGERASTRQVVGDIPEYHAIQYAIREITVVMNELVSPPAEYVDLYS